MDKTTKEEAINDIANKEARERQEVQPRLLPRAQAIGRLQQLQEDLFERQRAEEAPTEKHQVPIATREGYQREVPKDATIEVDEP